MDEFLPFSHDGQEAAADRFVRWLKNTVVRKACGADSVSATDNPRDRVWLGRLAPAAVAATSGRDSRLERMEPCAIGFRVRPTDASPWRMNCLASFFLWKQEPDKSWSKVGPVTVKVDAETRA